MISVLSAGRDSPAELRARLALDEPARRVLLARRPSEVPELVVLCTCHRTELYAVGEGAESETIHELASLLPLTPNDHQDLRVLHGLEAVEHLVRVACGLDSLVVGEPQVLGQVRRAFVLAQDEGSAGPVLSNLFGRALRLGRRVRAETALGRPGRSLGALAARHLADTLGGLEERRGVVVGAGEAAADAVESLRVAGAEISVVSRSFETAQALAGRLGAQAYPIADVGRLFSRSDFAVLAVSGGVLVGDAHIPPRPPGRPLLLVDLSFPAAVDVGPRGDVRLTTIDELPPVDGSEIGRAVEEAERIVRAEMVVFERWGDARESGAVIRDLRHRAERVVQDEVGRAVSGLELSPEQAERVAALAMRVANKLLHGPTAALRNADPETRRLIARMFGFDK